MQETVDRVVADEGFGFIIGPNGEEYFFHRTALKGVDWEELGPGVPVIFQATVEEGDRPDEHLWAVDIVLAPDAVPAVDNEPLPRKVRWRGLSHRPAAILEASPNQKQSVEAVELPRIAGEDETGGRLCVTLGEHAVADQLGEY